MLAISILILGFAIGFGDAITKSNCPAHLPRDQYLQVFNGFCYHFDMFQRNIYWDADSQCRQNGGLLAVVNDNKTLDFIANYISNDFKMPAWIGMPFQAVDPVTESLQHYGGLVGETLHSVCQYTPKYTQQDCPKQLSRDTYLQVHKDKCYRFAVKDSDHKSFREASKDCKKTGGSLVVIKSRELNNYVTTQIYTHYSVDSFTWIGLSDEHDEGKYVWEDGTVLNAKTDFTNWAFNEGQHYYGILFPIWEDYVVIHPKSGTWFDHSADYSGHIPYVCQYNVSKANTETTSSPSASSNPTTLAFSTEAPTPSMTLDLGINNCPILTHLTKYLRFYNNMCYLFVVFQHRLFKDAERDCKKVGGVLVVIKSKQVNDYIWSTLKYDFNGTSETWIGLSDEGGILWEGKYYWTDGSRLMEKDYTNWGSFEGPDHMSILIGHNEDYVSIGPNNGIWSDHDDRLVGKLPYVCQMEPIAPTTASETETTDAKINS